MSWLRNHGWEVAFGITTHTLWFWPLKVTSVTTGDFSVSFNLATRAE